MVRQRRDEYFQEGFGRARLKLDKGEVRFEFRS